MSPPTRVSVDPQHLQVDVLRQAIESSKGKELDVLIPSRGSLDLFEKEVRQIYGYAPPDPSECDLRVLTTTNSELQKFDVVSTGGTFDHLHYGHKLMLTIAAYSARSKVILGVTGPELLVNKKYAEALEPFETRAKNAREFVKSLRPDVEVEVYAMHDMYGPTITIEKMDALVVSAETEKGGYMVNDKRKEMGRPQLEVIAVGLVGGEQKLSSTDLRKKALQKEEKLALYEYMT